MIDVHIQIIYIYMNIYVVYLSSNVSHYHSMLLIGISLCLAGWQECCVLDAFLTGSMTVAESLFWNLENIYMLFIDWWPKPTCCWLIEMLWSQKQGEVIKTRRQVLSNSVWTWNKTKYSKTREGLNGNVTVVQ